MQTIALMNKTLQKDFNKFGYDNFLFEALDYLEPKEDKKYDCRNDIEVLEQMRLKKLQPCGDKGYNR